MPELSVEISDGRIARVEVLRGAPCGATWDAARKLLGVAVENAARFIGLEVQFFCSANPAGWDPIHGKSPVHFAGRVHSRAMQEALERLERR